MQTLTNRRWTHFSFFAPPRLYGILVSSEQARTLKGHLTELGIPPQHIELLQGERGVRELNPEGENRGLWPRLLRLIQSVTDERTDLSRYARALFTSRLVMVVDMPRDDQQTKDALCHAFRRAGATRVDYHGRYLNEALIH